MKKKILLVDDKATIGKVASIYLGKDYDVMYLENPIKAIDWLNEGNVPDLIISDIGMPLMRGDEFLRYMKANEFSSQFPSLCCPAKKVPRKGSNYWKKEQKTIF